MNGAHPAGLRRLLHPLVPAVALAALVVAGSVAVLRGSGVSAAMLACAAGCAAGFANSGST